MARRRSEIRRQLDILVLPQKAKRKIRKINKSVPQTQTQLASKVKRHQSTVSRDMKDVELCLATVRRTTRLRNKRRQMWLNRVNYCEEVMRMLRPAHPEKKNA